MQARWRARNNLTEEEPMLWEKGSRTVAHLDRGLAVFFGSLPHNIGRSGRRAHHAAERRLFCVAVSARGYVEGNLKEFIHLEKGRS